MPATPAWPPRSTPRLYVGSTLDAGLILRLDGPPAHYLATVLRLTVGAPVRLFDDISGEWLATIANFEKRAVTLKVGVQLATRAAVPDLWLLFAPIKHGRIDWLVEKATELGVARLQPVITARTIVDRLNLDRLRAHMIEAAEQCDRTSLPALLPAVRLDALLGGWEPSRALLFADECGGTSLAAAAQAHRGSPAALLIGPEGGFSDEERVAIGATPGTQAVGLGPRILRADTAAAAALAVWMAAAGDW